VGAGFYGSTTAQRPSCMSTRTASSDPDSFVRRSRKRLGVAFRGSASELVAG